MTDLPYGPEMPVHLADYDAAWAGLFLEERGRLEKALAGHRPVVEHIGSTAIPGMPAKPVIDIMVLIGDIGNAP